MGRECVHQREGAIVVWCGWRERKKKKEYIKKILDKE
jgi:hypothetical protein